MDYLGHVVSKEGVQVDDSKVSAIKQWPVPTSAKQLRAFLGLASYYRKFIKNFAVMAAPLTDLLKKDAFNRTELSQQTFALVKEGLTHASILAILNFSKPFVLEADVLGTGIGAVLSQDNHPIAFFSKKTSPLMQKQSAYAREMYAITQAMAKFRHYLLGHRFVIRTDHKSLKGMQSRVIQTPK